MNYWRTLGVDKTTDQRAIKRAYAAKLKKTKPDEDLEGFKKLHAAYKWAVNYAKNNYKENGHDDDYIEESGYSDNQSVTPIEMEKLVNTSNENEHYSSRNPPVSEYFQSQVHDDVQDDADDVHEYTFNPPVNEYFYPQGEELIEEQEPFPYIDSKHQVKNFIGKYYAHKEDEFEFLQNQRQILTDLVDEVSSEFKKLNILEAWQFLEGRTALFDLQFKSEFSHYVFGRIVERLQKENIRKPVARDVYAYLNSKFCWDDRRDYLENEFGYDAVEQILIAGAAQAERGIQWTVSKFHTGTLEYANYLIRLIAAAFDMIVFGLIFLLLAGINIDPLGIDESRGLAFLMGLILYMIASPILEATPMQGTLGKVIFGMKVVTPKGKRLNILHALFRGLLFAIFTALLKLTAWLNLFTDGRLLHDLVSGSIVVKR